MESFDVIQIIDQLKMEHNSDDLQGRLNRWKSLIIRMDMNNQWDFKKFKKELNDELLIIQSILKQIK
jgi:hypothetical protein